MYSVDDFVDGPKCASEGVIFTVPCPEGFQWHAKVNKCYSSQAINQIPGTDVLNMCMNLHATARPVEPRNQEQMHTIEKIASTA